MDGTLHIDFWKSEMNRCTMKKSSEYHLNISKSYIDFEDLEGVAQKLGLPCVIQNYPDLSKEMKVGHKKPLFGESYLIRTHFLVNFWPKMIKIGPIFVCFGSYWMLISMVKKNLVIFYIGMAIGIK